MASWSVPYTGSGPQFSPPLDFRTIDSAFVGSAGTANVEVRVWDGCTGADQRWQVGGSANGQDYFWGVVVLGAV